MNTCINIERISYKILFSLSAVFLFRGNPADAQVRKNADGPRGSLYFSAGYSKAWFTHSTIHVNQQSLNNNYDMPSGKADNLSYSSFSPVLMNYRVGYYFNYDQTFGIEINLDPANYHIADGQQTQLKGTIGKIPNQDQSITFSKGNGYYYYLNGANLGLINFVRRYRLVTKKKGKLALDALGKVGIGPALPTVVTELAGRQLENQFAYGGWNAGIETAARFTYRRHVYLEVAQKFDYAMLSGLPVYEGTSKQNLGAYELIFSLGYTFRTSRHNSILFGFKNIKY